MAKLQRKRTVDIRGAHCSLRPMVTENVSDLGTSAPAQQVPTLPVQLVTVALSAPPSRYVAVFAALESIGRSADVIIVKVTNELFDLVTLLSVSPAKSSC